MTTGGSRLNPKAMQDGVAETPCKPHTLILVLASKEIIKYIDEMALAVIVILGSPTLLVWILLRMRSPQGFLYILWTLPTEVAPDFLHGQIQVMLDQHVSRHHQKE